jgi:hypothetical protein
VAKRPRSKSATGRGRPPPAETAHARRIRLYLEKHPGATKAQARGHKPAEHATRKERARAAGRLDENQRATIKRFAKLQASRKNSDSGELYRAMVERFDRKGGYRDFERIKAEVARHAGMKRGRNRVRSLDKSGKTVTIEHAAERVWDDFEDFAERYDVPEEWLYYH